MIWKLWSHPSLSHTLVAGGPDFRRVRDPRLPLPRASLQLSPFPVLVNLICASE